MKTISLLALTAGVSLTACTSVDAPQVVDISSADLVGRNGPLEIPLHDGDTYRIDRHDMPDALDHIRFTDDELVLDASLLVPADVHGAPILTLTAEATGRRDEPWSFTLDAPYIQAKPNDGELTCVEYGYYEMTVEAAGVTVKIPIWFCKAWN